MKLHCKKHPKIILEYDTVTFVYKGDSVIPKDKNRNEIRCEVAECGEFLVLKGWVGKAGFPMIATFSSMSTKAKKEHMKKRAKDFNKLKINKDHRRYLNTSHLTNHG